MFNSFENNFKNKTAAVVLSRFDNSKKKKKLPREKNKLNSDKT
jgi:hypothetical protein